MVPDDGSSSPAISPSIVDLPLPDAPVTATNSPSRMSKDTRSNIVSSESPERTVFETSESEIIRLDSIRSARTAETSASRVSFAARGRFAILIRTAMYRVIRIFWALSFVALAICLNSCAAGGDRTRAPKPLKTPAEQDDRPKIIAFGDSLTAGFGLTEKESYPYLLQEKLRADGFDYDVVNAGVSGDTTLGGLERIDWALENDNVRILILELGANDLLRGIPPDKMRSNLDQIIRKTKAKGVRILLCGMLAADARPTISA